MYQWRFLPFMSGQRMEVVTETDNDPYAEMNGQLVFYSFVAPLVKFQVFQVQLLWPLPSSTILKYRCDPYVSKHIR